MTEDIFSIRKASYGLSETARWDTVCLRPRHQPFFSSGGCFLSLQLTRAMLGVEKTSVFQQFSRQPSLWGVVSSHQLPSMWSKDLAALHLLQWLHVRIPTPLCDRPWKVSVTLAGRTLSSKSFHIKYWAVFQHVSLALWTAPFWKTAHIWKVIADEYFTCKWQGKHTFSLQGMSLACRLVLTSL